ncbi:helix-turn-helix domain-containing protein [Piscirickettsia litoralis]|nr:helix-turn-helix transcriptional regulator [Piscirickettsia litoralis]
MGIIDKEVGRRLKTVRKARGYKTAKEFAEKNSINVTTYVHHEAGTRRLHPELIIRYCDVLHISSNWLIQGYGNSGLERPLNIKYIEQLDEIKGKYQIVNVDLFKLILNEIIVLVSQHGLIIPSSELTDFSIDVYNSIIGTSIPENEAKQLIKLSVNSIKRAVKHIEPKAIESL